MGGLRARRAALVLIVAALAAVGSGCGDDEEPTPTEVTIANRAVAPDAWMGSICTTITEVNAALVSIYSSVGEDPDATTDDGRRAIIEAIEGRAEEVIAELEQLDVEVAELGLPTVPGAQELVEQARAGIADAQNRVATARQALGQVSVGDEQAFAEELAVAMRGLEAGSPTFAELLDRAGRDDDLDDTRFGDERCANL